MLKGIKALPLSPFILFSCYYTYGTTHTNTCRIKRRTSMKTRNPTVQAQLYQFIPYKKLPLYISIYGFKQKTCLQKHILVSLNVRKTGEDSDFKFVYVYFQINIFTCFHPFVSSCYKGVFFISL